MTTKTEEKKEELERNAKFDPSDYSCEILLEKTTMDKAKDPNFPSDAFYVYYNKDNKELLDVTRSSKMVNVFNLYYDRYGKNAVQKIEYGHGSVNPNMWGYQKKEKKPIRKR